MLLSKILSTVKSGKRDESEFLDKLSVDNKSVGSVLNSLWSLNAIKYSQLNGEVDLVYCDFKENVKLDTSFELPKSFDYVNNLAFTDLNGNVLEVSLQTEHRLWTPKSKSVSVLATCCPFSKLILKVYDVSPDQEVLMSGIMNFFSDNLRRIICSLPKVCDELVNYSGGRVYIGH